MASKTLAVVITGDASGAQKAFQTTEAGAGGLGDKVAAAGKKMADVGKNLSLGITLPVAALATVGFKELEDSGRVAAQTEAAIKSTGGAAHVSAKQVDELAQSLMNKSGMDDEAIKSGENLLLTFTNVRNEAGKGNDIFNQATKATLDLSVAFGKDMTQSAVLVGKALNDPIKGVTALSRVGVTFSQVQKDQIKNFMEAGDVMSAQKVILAELNKEVGGSAEAYGKTMAGQVSKAKEELKNASAAMVTVAAPALKLVADGAMAVAGFLEHLSPAAKTAVAGFAVLIASVGPVLTVFGNLMKLAPLIVSFGQMVQGAFAVVRNAVVNAVIAIQEMGVAAAVGPVAAFAAIVAAALAVGYVLHRIFGGDGEMQKALDGFAKARKAGEGWGDTIVAGAKASGNSISELRARLDTLRQSQKSELDALRESGGSFEEAVKIHGKYKGAIDTVKEAISQEKQAHRESVAAIKAQYDALVGLNSGTQTLAGTTDAARQAVQNFNNTLLAAAGGPIGYQQALLNVNAAQQHLNELQSSGTATADEIAAATLAVQSAQLQASAAANSMDQSQAALTQSLLAGGHSASAVNDAYNAQLGLLYQQISLHPENAAGILLEKQKLDEAKKAADDLVAGGPYSPKVDADTSEALGKIGAVKGELGDLNGTTTTHYVDIITREIKAAF